MVPTAVFLLVANRTEQQIEVCPVPSRVGAGHPGRDGPVTGRDTGISRDTAKDIIDRDDTGIKVSGPSPGESL